MSIITNQKGILGPGWGNAYLESSVPRTAGGGKSRTPPAFSDVVHWYDFADTGTLWQDEAMTIPAVADEDPINVITDKGMWRHDLSTELTTDPEVDLVSFGRPTGVFLAQTLGGIDTDFPMPQPGAQWTSVSVAASTAAAQEQYNHYWHSIPRHGHRMTATDEVTTTLDAGAVSTANYALGEIVGLLARADGSNINVQNSLDDGPGFDFVDGTYAINFPSANFRVGGYNESGLGEYFEGNIMEIIWWDRPLSDVEIAEVKVYLNNKWGMGWT